MNMLINVPNYSHHKFWIPQCFSSILLCFPLYHTPLLACLSLYRKYVQSSSGKFWGRSHGNSPSDICGCHQDGSQCCITRSQSDSEENLHHIDVEHGDMCVNVYFCSLQPLLPWVGLTRTFHGCVPMLPLVTVIMKKTVSTSMVTNVRCVVCRYLTLTILSRGVCMRR